MALTVAGVASGVHENECRNLRPVLCRAPPIGRNSDGVIGHGCPVIAAVSGANSPRGAAGVPGRSLSVVAGASQKTRCTGAAPRVMTCERRAVCGLAPTAATIGRAEAHGGPEMPGTLAASSPAPVASRRICIRGEDVAEKTAGGEFHLAARAIGAQPEPDLTRSDQTECQPCERGSRPGAALSTVRSAQEVPAGQMNRAPAGQHVGLEPAADVAEDAFRS